MDTRDDGDGRRDDVNAESGENRPGGAADSDRSDDSDPTDVAASALGADGVREEDPGEVGIAEAVGEDRPPLGPLEPGSPTPENVLFVVLGALATVALVATLL